MGSVEFEREPSPASQVGLSASRLQRACAAASGSKYMVIMSGSGQVDVVIAQDAGDSDLLEAYAAALLAGGHVAVSVETLDPVLYTEIFTSVSIYSHLHLQRDFHHQIYLLELHYILVSNEQPDSVLHVPSSVGWSCMQRACRGVNCISPCRRTQGHPVDTTLWLQRVWTEFVDQLSTAGWVLDRPRLPMLPFRAIWRQAVR